MGACKLGVLLSGGGTNLQAILDSCETGLLRSKAEVAIVISNKEDAFGLARAKQAGIPALHLDPKQFPSRTEYFAKIISELKKHEISLICLAGFLLKIEPNLIREFPKRILNIHPALLPKYGGKGMYGHFVHEAVIRAGEKESGCTVHIVDEEFDHGPILAQRKILVLANDRADTLAERVLKEEHILFPEAIAQYLKKI